MNCLLGIRRSSNNQYPDAEGAEVTRKTQNRKNLLKDVLPRLLRNFCAFCVRLLVFDFQCVSPTNPRSSANHFSTGTVPGNTGCTVTGNCCHAHCWPSCMCSSPLHW
jgi:hypothetical protein